MADEFTVLFNLFPAIAKAIEEAAQEAVKATAEEIQVLAGENAPELTGFMKSSIYVAMKDTSTYGEGVVAGAPGSYMLEEVRPTDSDTAYVAVAANYGIYPELGTIHMAAQPYLVPAAETARPAFLARMEALEEAVRKKVGGL